MSQLESRIDNIIQWAEEREIFECSDTESQFLKTISEMGELADAIKKWDIDAIADGYGDVIVTLILGMHLAKLDMQTCLDAAYAEISSRKGKMINGVFVKDE